MVAPQIAQPDPVIELRLTLNARTGQFGITGPIQDKVLAYGMLHLAMEVVAKQGSASVREQTGLAVPPAGARVR